MTAGDQLEQAFLRDVRVLVLVDEDVAEHLPVRLSPLVVVLKKSDGFALQAAVVKGSFCGQRLDVQRADSREIVVGRLEVVVAQGDESEGLLDEGVRRAEAEVVLGVEC